MLCTIITYERNGNNLENSFRQNGSGHIEVEHNVDSTIFRAKLINRKGYIIKIGVALMLYWAYILYTYLNLETAENFDIYAVISIVISAMTIIPMLWSRYGYEEIQLNEDSLIIRNRLWKIGWRKKYKYKDIRNVRLNIGYKERTKIDFNIFYLSEVAGVNVGYVRFDYLIYECKFGNTFSPQEAYMFVELLEEKISKYNRFKFL